MWKFDVLPVISSFLDANLDIWSDILNVYTQIASNCMNIVDHCLSSSTMMVVFPGLVQWKSRDAQAHQSGPPAGALPRTSGSTLQGEYATHDKETCLWQNGGKCFRTGSRLMWTQDEPILSEGVSVALISDLLSHLLSTTSKALIPTNRIPLEFSSTLCLLTIVAFAKIQCVGKKLEKKRPPTMVVDKHCDSSSGPVNLPWLWLASVVTKERPVLRVKRRKHLFLSGVSGERYLVFGYLWRNGCSHTLRNGWFEKAWVTYVAGSADSLYIQEALQLIKSVALQQWSYHILRQYWR